MSKFLIRILVLAVGVAALQGCDKFYREDLENCYAGVSVVLRADPSTSGGQAAAEAAAEHVVLYVFDSEGAFLERRETVVGRTELFEHRTAGPLEVVGWINKDTLRYNVTPFGREIVNRRRDDGRVTLNAGGSRAVSNSPFPTDLFYGDGALTNDKTSFEVEHKEIFAKRRTGQANITVRSLKEYAGIYDEDYYIVIGPTANEVDFYGTTRGADLRHTPAAAFNDNDELIAPNFNLLPTEADVPLTVQIWHKTGGLIYETTEDQLGVEIHVSADNTTNILIDFTAEIKLSVERSEWGVSHVWKVFN